MSAGFKPKLIEVALPLAAISAEAAREKFLGSGHPQTLHKWWARRPLAACRAVLWASFVDDPSVDGSLSVEEQDRERERLFGILERLVVWKNSNDLDVLAEARAEIDRCFPDGPPSVLDPFAGGGSIALEAQRLGLKALAGDLNPVAVLINKAMIEIPPRFAGQPPVHPELRNEMTTWERAQGLAADVEAYGRWMRDEAQKRIGHLYPNAAGPGGETLPPIAWIWVRTVESPDPAWKGHVPLASSWYLAKPRRGKPSAWIEPLIDRARQSIRYQIRMGGEPSRQPTVSRGNGVCIATGAAVPGDYIKAEGRAGRMGTQLMAVVAEGDNGRVYCPVLATDAVAAAAQQPGWVPHGKNPEKLTGGTVFVYGLDEWWKLFSPRQLVALTTFSDLLAEARLLVEERARSSGLTGDEVRLRDGGDGPAAYADAVVTYLAFAVDRCADLWSTISTWDYTNQKMRSTFGRQAIPMSWDFAEANPFSTSTGNWIAMVGWVRKAVAELPSTLPGAAAQRDARARVRECAGVAVSTDPPYYDNISYADLSDFFYVWLRRNLADVWLDECSTLLTPKAEEMIANPYRAGSQEAARQHFEAGMTGFMSEVAEAVSPHVPTTIHYAFKATQTDDGATRFTGWATFLQGVVDAGMQVTATWPMRTENQSRLIALGANALASSIVLACRPRSEGAQPASRGEFLAALRSELPKAIRLLQSGIIAPVDMAQSAIGPGISIFSRYSEVRYADGSAMPVSDALAIINEVLGEILDGEASELDEDTRFALDWYAQHGFEAAGSGDADNLARAKNTSLAGIGRAGIGEARAGKFRLYRRDELPEGWDPDRDDRLTAWEAAQHLVATLERSETHAAGLLHRLGAEGDSARQLAYLLYAKADANDWTDEAFAYNMLISAWSDLRSMGETTAGQGALL